jgi:hypothetical protein
MIHDANFGLSEHICIDFLFLKLLDEAIHFLCRIIFAKPVVEFIIEKMSLMALLYQIFQRFQH